MHSVEKSLVRSAVGLSLDLKNRMKVTTFGGRKCYMTTLLEATPGTLAVNTKRRGPTMAYQYHDTLGTQDDPQDSLVIFNKAMGSRRWGQAGT